MVKKEGGGGGVERGGCDLCVCLSVSFGVCVKDRVFLGYGMYEQHIESFGGPLVWWCVWH